MSTWRWYVSVDARLDVPGVDVHPGLAYYLRDVDAATAPEGWLRPLTDPELARLPAFWYRCERAWRDGRYAVTPGRVYQIDPALAEHILRDTDGAIRRLSPAEVVETGAALRYAAEATGHSATPPGPEVIDPGKAVDGTARGGTGVTHVMSRANSGMFGH